MNEEFAKLERLSLVNSITKEINNHIGLQDSTLAEYLISLREEASSLDQFKSKLQDIGAEFPTVLLKASTDYSSTYIRNSKKSTRLHLNRKAKTKMSI